MKILEYQRKFTATQSIIIPQDHYEEGEDCRWMVKWQDGQLDFIRTWSGLCIYRVHLRKVEDCWVVEKAYVLTENYAPDITEDLCKNLDNLFSSLILYKVNNLCSKALTAYEDLRERTFEKDLETAYMIKGYPHYLNFKSSRFREWIKISANSMPEESWVKYALPETEMSEEARPIFLKWKNIYSKKLKPLSEFYENVFENMLPQSVFVDYYGTNETERCCELCNLPETEDDSVMAVLTYSKRLRLVCKKCEAEAVAPKYFKEVYTVRDYEAWDHLIYQAGIIFHQEHGVWPQILVASPATLEAFDNFMNEKLLKEGRISSPQQVCSFECSKFTLRICTDPDGHPREFKLIFDEQATFLEEKAS